MIDQEIIRRIERLLAEGKLSQREIARVLGISRGTVLIIASGRRPDYEELRQRREREETPIPFEPQKRCRTCGAIIVYSTCMACRLRGTGHGVGRMGDDGSGPSLNSDLDRETMQRYKRIHAMRRARGEAQRDMDGKICDRELTAV